MNKGMLTVGIIFLSLIALLLINVLTNYSTGSELDYYLVKETTDAAIEDALDDYYYTSCKIYRMDKEKFVESFVYRFAKSVDASRNYKISFYDINEVPPKVSVKVDSLTVLSFKTGEKTKQPGNITTSYDAILEANYKGDPAAEYGLKVDAKDKDSDYDQCKSPKLLRAKKNS